MLKYMMILALVLAFSSCSRYSVNATMCDKIAKDADDDMIPKECRNYIESEAQKAFDKTKHKKESSDDTVEFTKK